MYGGDAGVDLAWQFQSVRFLQQCRVQPAAGLSSCARLRR